MPNSLWITLAVFMMLSGSYLGFGGMKLTQAGHTDAGVGLVVLGFVFLVWGWVVFRRTVNRKS